MADGALQAFFGVTVPALQFQQRLRISSILTIHALTAPTGYQGVFFGRDRGQPSQRPLLKSLFSPQPAIGEKKGDRRIDQDTIHHLLPYPFGSDGGHIAARRRPTIMPIPVRTGGYA